uniref:Uncharacterized protein n=1 Tax=Noccaea caerulescens TaxID=107243 RepID=A0A1J3GVD5_NOCCA
MIVTKKKTTNVCLNRLIRWFVENIGSKDPSARRPTNRVKKRLRTTRKKPKTIRKIRKIKKKITKTRRLS